MHVCCLMVPDFHQVKTNIAHQQRAGDVLEKKDRVVVGDFSTICISVFSGRGSNLTWKTGKLPAYHRTHQDWSWHRRNYLWTYRILPWKRGKLPADHRTHQDWLWCRRSCPWPYRIQPWRRGRKPVDRQKRRDWVRHKFHSTPWRHHHRYHSTLWLFRHYRTASIPYYNLLPRQDWHHIVKKSFHSQ